ncbi:MAG: GIY-YIG nuclease family protein [Elusimicrobia bacterium]|nr:GIY-YIG nuclease family protein [Elusimicrobiota bacterium]
MKENKGGVIYILTNPSFPKYVKIGYSDNVEQRLDELNRSECIPFAFRLYAYYKVDNRLSDKKVHELIDSLNPDLRSKEKYKGKERKREFFAMSKEEAYKILKSIATINNLEKNLILVPQTKAEIEDEERANEIEDIPLTLETFYTNKNQKLIELHELLFKKFKEIHKEIYEEVKPNYIAIKNKKGKNICEVHIYKTQLMIVTREPKNNNLKIGNKVPDNYSWTLNYKIYFDNEKDIDNIINVLLDIYEQIK